MCVFCLVLLQASYVPYSVPQLQSIKGILKDRDTNVPEKVGVLQGKKEIKGCLFLYAHSGHSGKLQTK